MKFLVVVDMQNDFVDGSLGTKEAQSILPNVAEKIRAADRAGDQIFYTQDTHGADYLSTMEGKKLPVPHCIEGTPGWELAPAVKAALEECDSENVTGLTKPTFGSTLLTAHLEKQSRLWGAPEEIEFIGLCTGICVLSNAILTKADFCEFNITVDAACCACVTPKSHETALDAMELCHIAVKNRGCEPWKQ